MARQLRRCGWPAASVAVLGLALAGCEVAGLERETVGTIAGGVGGAVLGTQVGSGTGQVVATAVGALGGALIGREIARYLEERDQERMAQSTDQAIATGESQTWRNPDTGVSGDVQVSDAGRRSGTADVQVRGDQVDEIPPLHLIGMTYVTTTGVNLRSGPGAGFRSVGQFPEGERVHAIGEVEGRDWYLVSRDGQAADGFIAARNLRRAEPGEVVVGWAPTEVAEGTTASVQITQDCQQVDQTIVLQDGSRQQETYTICTTPAGPQRVEV